MRLAPCALVLLAVGCGQKPTEVRPAPAAPSVASEQPAIAAAPRPDVTLTLRGPGELDVEGAASLTTEMRVEKREGTEPWTALEQADPFRLRATCEGTPAACTELRAGATLHVVKWSGLLSSSQCGLGVRGTSGHPAATIRFVASTCEHGARFESPSFEVPAMVHADMADRLWAADALTAVTAVRVDQPPKWNAAQPASASAVAGFEVRPATNVTLDDAQRAQLAALLRAPAGYDDKVMKRCRMEHLIGFRLTRTLPTTALAPRTQGIEMGIDLTCNRIVLVRGDAAPRAVHASHFDPSRPAFVQLVKALFPTDRELAAVK